MTRPEQMLLPLAGAWPISARLRFRPDAHMRQQYLYLRGTPVLVLGPLTYKAEANDWRQYVAAFGARWDEDRYGWALPDQLEPIPGEGDDPAMQLGDETAPEQEARVPSPEAA